jgi:hypothetical protein
MRTEPIVKLTRVPRLGRVAVVTLALFPAGCGDGKSPTAPAPSSTGLSVTFPGGGTIYIGAAALFEAVETLSNGTTRAAAAIWSSDAPTVATVTQSGVVTALAAGEATITAAAGERRGTLRVRVFPNFTGVWSGIESGISCDDTGAFDGLCGDPEVYEPGQRFRHDSRYTQTDASVSVTLDLGEQFTASGPGTVSVPGDLQLPTTRVLPDDEDVKIDIQDLRFRSDVPGRLTGTYFVRFTAPGVDGSLVLGVRLESVTRTTLAAPASVLPIGEGGAVPSRWDSLARRMTLRGRHPQVPIN